MPTENSSELIDMDIFFNDPEAIPLPPNEVRILSLEAKTWPDGKRAAVQFSLTPFQKRPNVELQIFDEASEVVAELSVVEVVQNKMDFTLHLRGEVRPGKYTVKMKVLYTDLDQFDQEKEEAVAAGDILAKSSEVVDQAETQFEIP